jgi:hypothetical protein
MNPGKIPIQEISTNNAGGKLQSLISSYNYYMGMIRDVTGLNEARDGSNPDANALVGVQKLAAANSNTATRHIQQSSVFITTDLAQNLSLRISDIIEYSPMKDSFIQKIGAHNVAILGEIGDLYLHDFGINIELVPDEEERQMLENNIQVSLAKGTIDVEDAIDIREIKNLKLANQVLKIRRKKKIERDQALQQQNIQAQAQANMQTQQQAAQLEIQKEQQIIAQKIELEKTKAEYEMTKMEKEVQAKKELMQLEFDLNMKLKGIEAEAYKAKEGFKEDRKDERTKIQASQQSQLIDQRHNATGPKDFESAGNDIMGGGFGLNSFEPK